MSTPSGSSAKGPVPIRRRRPPPGERNRGAVDALQTKIAVNVQNLDESRFKEQLRDNIAELPEAAGCDAAYLALFRKDLSAIDTIIASSSVFSSCNPDALTGESLSHWPWLSKRLGHLRVIEVTDTEAGPKVARTELDRLNELGIGSVLILGFAVRNEVAGYLAFVNEHPVESWDASLHLLIKLIGTSLSSGLERMRSVSMLDEMEDRNELVSLTANDGIWDFDGRAKKIRLSRRWKDMLGYDINQEDVLPDWYRLVHPDDMARVQAKMREHLEGKSEFFESVHRMKHQNGEWRWMTSRAKARQDEMAAFFSRIALKRTVEWKEEIVFPSPAPARSMWAVFPDGSGMLIRGKTDPRRAFADWLLRRVESVLGRQLEQRSLIFFAILLGSALIGFALIRHFADS